MRRITMMAVAAALLAACDSSTEPLPYPQWAAELEGVAGHEGVSGAADAAGGAAAFIAAIEVDDLADGTYQWEIAAGTCAEPGNRVGAADAYTALTPENGTATAEVTVGAVLSAAGTYHVAVFDVVEDERANIACGDFERTN